MKNALMKQVPLSIGGARKSEVRTQFAALCYRVQRDKPEILMITSRGTRRWILPKGWPIDGETPAQSAATEAWEEAGVRGKVHERCLGLYSYEKTDEPGGPLTCVALVYPIKVQSLAKEYPEEGQRRRKWVSPKKAASMVEERELAPILRGFDPKLLREPKG